MKKIIYLLLISTVFVCSCKKDLDGPSGSVNNLAADTEDQRSFNRTGISPAEVNAWFAKNPAARYLVPDWSQAQQRLIGNVAVVKVPIQDIAGSNTLQVNARQQLNGLRQNAIGDITAARPLMLYLLKDKKATGDTVRPILMNFMPDSQNSENGIDNIWSGKLVEWDLQSDVMPYQVLKKSYVSAKGAINFNESVSSLSANGAAKLKVNNLISAIWDALKWFVEGLGQLLGVPGDYGHFNDIDGWCNFLAGIFCGGGGGGSSGGGGGASYSIIYSSYIPGYGGYDAVNEGWSQYPDGDPCLGLSSATKLKVNQEEGGCPIALGPVNAFADYYELLPNQKAWLNQHVEVYSALNIYIDGESLSFEDAQDFVDFAVVYLMGHPNVPLSKFVNQFAMPGEGLDDPEDYDENYWNDPNLQIQQQALPSFQNFSDNYPGKPAPEVYKLIGGIVWSRHLADPVAYGNACALRVSRALNYCGITVPELSGQTLKGADGKNYFLGAKNLNKWMNKTFGAPTHHFTQAQGGAHGVNFAGLLNGKKGIYSMVSSNPVWGTGHADIIDNSICAMGCHFDGPVLFIDLWILQ